MKMSVGMQEVKKKKYSWEAFWKAVNKNNELLKYNCEIGMYDEVEELLTKGRDGYPTEINCKGMDDWRPVHYVSYEGHADILNLLIKHNAIVNAYTKFHRNPLHIASIRGFIEIVKLLVENKIDINAVDNDGNTALHFAC